MLRIEADREGIRKAQRDGELVGAGQPPQPAPKRISEVNPYPGITTPEIVEPDGAQGPSRGDNGQVGGRPTGRYATGESVLGGKPGWSTAWGARWYTKDTAKVVRWLLPVRVRPAAFWEPVIWWLQVQGDEGSVKVYGAFSPRRSIPRTQFPALPGKPVWGWRARVVACYTLRRWSERILTPRPRYWLGRELKAIERGKQAWTWRTTERVLAARKVGEARCQRKRIHAEMSAAKRKGQVLGPRLRITLGRRPALTLLPR